MKTGKYASGSEAGTLRLAARMGCGLEAGDIVVLAGELGAGKTLFTKGLAKGLGIRDYLKVKSPTFSLVHEIRGGRWPLFHFDLYRLETAEELFEIGFDEYLDQPAVSVIEWGDKFADQLNRPWWEVRIQVKGAALREIFISHHR